MKKNNNVAKSSQSRKVGFDHVLQRAFISMNECVLDHVLQRAFVSMNACWTTSYNVRLCPSHRRLRAHARAGAAARLLAEAFGVCSRLRLPPDQKKMCTRQRVRNDTTDGRTNTCEDSSTSTAHEDQARAQNRRSCVSTARRRPRRRCGDGGARGPPPPLSN